MRDLVPVTQLIDLYQMVVAHPSVSANTLQELVLLARSKPQVLNYGSYGSGSQPHLLFESLKAQAGIQITHVPYKGIAPALTAAIAGEVQLTMGGAGTTRGFFSAGKLKPLAVAATARLDALPAVPTSQEAGFPDLLTGSWQGLAAPRGTDPRILDKINVAVRAVLSDPVVRKRFADMGALTGDMSRAELTAFVRNEAARWKKVIDAAGIQHE